MSDLERRLRIEPAGEREPSADRLQRAIAAEVDAGPGLRVAAPRVRARGAPGLGALAGIAAVLAFLLATRLAIPSDRPGTSASPGSDLLARVQASGSIRIAVRPDHPQFTRAGAGIVGFDVDVARTLASSLGLRADIVPLAASDMMGQPTAGWDLALPSIAIGSIDPGRFAASAPYYSWPHLLLASESSGLRRAADLAGRRVCAVEGDLGKAWLEGGAGAGIETIVLPMASDDACFAALTSGDVDALVTATSAPADLAVHPSLVELDGGPPSERRAAIATTASDPTRLLDRIDAAFAGMRSNGTLALLSERDFGSDLTSTP
jgi:polar amino acid transport system substrate-binding protein